MPNSLTAIAPVAYSAAQEVSSEPVGAVDAINMSFNDKGVAIGDKVTVPVAPMRAAKTYVPAMQSSAGDDATAEKVTVEITANKEVSWNLTGEQQLSLKNADTDKEWIRQLLSQGMRTLRNLAEEDAVIAIKKGASRAVGVAGTTPFASDLKALTKARKALKDNGAPMADLQCVIDTDSGLNLMDLGIVQQAHMAGSDAERRSGQFLKQAGFSIRESAGIVQHVKGTGVAYEVNFAAGYTKGARDIAVDTGAGTILAGDVVTFAADTVNQYVSGGLTGSVLALNRPGIRGITIPNNNVITVGNDYMPNLAFERSAVVGVMRPPAIPDSPLMKKLLISDKNGLTYLLIEIVGDGMITWRLHLAWGFQVVQPEHVALILG